MRARHRTTGRNSRHWRRNRARRSFRKWARRPVRSGTFGPHRAHTEWSHRAQVLANNEAMKEEMRRQAHGIEDLLARFTALEATHNKLVCVR